MSKTSNSTPKLSLEVGKSYLDSDENIVHIVNSSTHARERFPFIDADGYRWSKDGKRPEETQAHLVMQLQGELAYKSVTMPMNRVWIELERPRNTKHAAVICERANNFLQRLTPGTGYKFWWSEEKCMYAYGHISFQYLRDNGEWLNLDFLGRPLDMKAEDWSRA